MLASPPNSHLRTPTHNNLIQDCTQFLCVLPLSVTDLLAMDLSVTNLSAMDLSAMDLSVMDLLTTNISTTDLSTTDLSTTNLSTTNLNDEWSLGYIAHATWVLSFGSLLEHSRLVSASSP